MRKIGIILIASVMVLVMASSCRVVHIVTPEDFFETTGEVSATTAAREIDLNMLAKDIAEGAAGIKLPASWSEVSTFTAARASEKKAYSGTVTFDDYDNGRVTIVSGSMEVRFSGAVDGSKFTVNAFAFDDAELETVSRNRSYTAGVTGVYGTIGAVMPIDASGSTVILSKGSLTSVPVITTAGTVTVGEDTASTGEGTSSAVEDPWYSEDKTEFILDSVEDIISFGNIVSTGLDDFEGDTVELRTGTYDLFSYPNFMIGNGARTTADDKTSLNPYARPFRGTFDGNNSTIVGLHIEVDGNGDSDDNAYGFFAITDEASISNLAFRDCYVKTGSNTAGIAIGFGRHTDVDNVDVEDSEVYAFQGAGSLAGRLYVYVNGTVTVQNCDISGCIVEATVPASTPEDIKHRYNAGGFVGCLSSGGSDTGKLTKVINNTVTLDDEHYVEAFGFYAGGFVGTTSYAEYSGNTLIIESIDNIKCSYSNGTDNILGYLFSNGDGEILENNKVIINGEEEAITAENNQWKNESLPQIQN